MHSDVVDCDDVRVCEPGERLRLTQISGPLSVRRVVGARQKQFECDFSVELRIICRIDHAHAADSDEVHNYESIDLHATGTHGLLITLRNAISLAAEWRCIEAPDQFVAKHLT